MGFSDFWLQSNSGEKISLDNLKELKKSDLQNNAALIRIFNIFDTQNADGTKGADGVLNKEELTSLFNTMSSAAKLKGNASIFEVDEAEDYINTTQTSEGQTLKELGVKASDLFNFISALVPKNENNTTQVQSGAEAIQQSYTPEEIEDLSIQTVTDDVRKARQIFNSQNENQGVVSDFVNGTKETFDTEFAASRVNRYLMREELCADLLAQSKSEEGLSEKEYLEAKINLAVSMLPKLENSSLKSSIIKNILSLGLYEGFGNKTKAEQERIAEEMEIELLKDALRKLKPEDLTLFIQRVTAMPDAEYTEKAGQVVENMINQSLQEKIRDNQKPMADTNQVFIKHQPIPGSIEYIEQHSDAYKKMTFEETFEAERGVQYNQDNIMDYAEKDAKMQFLLGMHNKRQQIYNILHDATVTVDGNNKLGAPDTRAIKPCEEQLESAIIQALRNLYGDDIEKMQEGLNKLGISNLKIIQSGDENDLLHPMKLVYDYENSDNPNPLIKKMDLGGYDLVNIANKLQNYVDTNYENALGGKTLEEYGQEVNSAYQMAYGARNAQHMAEAFAESQQEGVQTVKTVVQTGGMVVMVAGQLVPVGGQIATALTMGGLATSTFGSVGVSALENFTKAGGATEEDKQEMLKELGVSLALVSSGMGIGKTSEAAFRALVIRNCPKLLAFASEVGIDATMSLVADYAITGQIDLSGEGIAQLQSVLVGILHAKGNFSSYLNTHAGNVTTKPNDLTSKPRIDDLPYEKTNPTSNKVSDIDINTSKINDFDNLVVEDFDGAPTPTNGNNQSAVNVYRLNSNPHAKLKEYSYTTSSGKTFKFMAAEGIDAKNFQFLANLDLRRRILGSTVPNFSKFSSKTQNKFAQLYNSDKARQNELLDLVKSLNKDEEKLLSIISNKDILDKRLADIKELKSYFNKQYDFLFLGGLLDIKNSDPEKFERIKSSGIFDLVKEGKLSAQSLGRLGLNADLSPEIYNDLALLKSGKSIVPEFAEGTDLKTAFEQTKLGDAVEVGGKMYLNDGNSLIEWNMTKEKYLELFPPVQRFATTQGTIGDCHLVQTLGLAMHNPKARVEFLQSFTLKGDDVVVTVKGLEDYHGSETFTNGNIELPKNNKHIIGCKGLQMYEQTYARVALREGTPVDYPNIASVDDVMQRTCQGQAAQTMADVFGQGHFIDLLPGQRMLKTDRGMIVGNTTPYTGASINEIPYKNPKDGKTYRIALNKIDNVKTRIQLIDKVFNDYPNKSLALRNLDLETTEELLKQYVNDTNYLFSFGTISKTGSVAESNLLPEYNLVSDHAYSILGYDESTKMVKIGNPHSYGQVTEIPLETLHQYIQHIDFLKL
ncbi:hypothetical protein IJ674_10500 [bacterium]|nr:hypothetical protein [bacterium]